MKPGERHEYKYGCMRRHRTSEATRKATYKDMTSLELPVESVLPAQRTCGCQSQDLCSIEQYQRQWTEPMLTATVAVLSCVFNKASDDLGESNERNT